MSKHEAVSRLEFVSDNATGACPEALAAMAEATQGYSLAYGDDMWTRRATDMMQRLFETDCYVNFVFTGTAANSLTLASMCQSYHSIICPRFAHVAVGECAAPGFFSGGGQTVALSTSDGKLTPAQIERAFISHSKSVQSSKPRAVSISQASEAGTVYSVEEMQALGALCTRLGLFLHVDGARFANAVASLSVAPAELTWRAGVDVLCFGGTKNGLIAGEAIVIFNRELAHEFDHRVKQAGQTASKMRFLSAPWVALLTNDTYLRLAAHANAMADRLATGLRGVPGLKISFPCEANAVFVQLGRTLTEKMRQRGWYIIEDVADGGARLMCSWNTTTRDVDSYLEDVRELVQEGKGSGARV